MLQTTGGNPRNFHELDLYSLPSPCFVIDKKALRSNLEVLQKLKFETNVKILIALKAFSTFGRNVTFPTQSTRIRSSGSHIISEEG